MQKHAKHEGDADNTKAGAGKMRMATTIVVLFIAIGLGLQLIAKRDELVTVTAKVTDCDRLAAHPADPHKLAPGVAQADVDIPAAKAACIKAYEANPKDGRILYQLGRTYVYNKEFEQGIEYFRESDAAGYAEGQFVLGLVLVQAYGTEPDMCGGGAAWVRAARQDHLYAKVYLVNNWMDNMFADCKLDITEQELDGMVSAAENLAETQNQKDDVAMLRKNWNERKH